MKRTSTTQEFYSPAPKVCLVERNECPGGLALVNANKVAKRSANDLVDLAMEIQKADSFVKATACNKLQVIVQQVRFLQQQAQGILQEAERNAQLHCVACNFVKVPGNVYHLYERPSGQEYFSMLSPEEWSCPHNFIGSYRLETDHSWTNAAQLAEKDYDFRQIHNLMQSRNPLCLQGLQEVAPMDQY